jgi:heptosyltransferase-2
MNPEKILMVGPAWVGDMVMAQTLYKLLQQRYPGCQIDVVAPPQTAPLVSRMPEITKAWTLPIKHKEFGLRARYQLAKELRKEHYTRAIVLPNSWKSALVPFLAGIPIRTGWIGEQRFGLLNDIRRLDKVALPLMIQRFAALAFPAKTDLTAFAEEFHFMSLPWPKFVVTEEQRQAALTQTKMSLTAQPILALCPGAEFGAAKRWPEEHYATLANIYLERGWAVWLFGSPKEQDAADHIMQYTQQRCVNLVGKTKLIEAIDLLANVKVVVTNDSGLMHVAAAVGKPVIVMYGSSSPRFTPPLTQSAQILSLDLNCSPCFQRECPLGHLKCLRDLLPEQVVAAVDAEVDKF